MRIVLLVLLSAFGLLMLAPTAAAAPVGGFATGAGVIAEQDMPRHQPEAARSEHSGVEPAAPFARFRHPVTWLVLAGAMVGLVVIQRMGWFRLDDHPNRPAAMEPALAFGAFILAWAAPLIAWQVGARLLAPGLSTSEWSMRQHALVGVTVYGAQLAALVPVLLAMRRVEQKRGRSFRRPTPLLAAVGGVAALIVAWPCAHVAGQMTAIVIELATGRATPVIAHSTLQELSAASMDVWLWARWALVAMLVPLIEEVMYRGIVQESLRRLGVGPWMAITGTSALFALMHLPAVPDGAHHAVVALFVLSLFFGWVYEKTGRLSASVTLHAAFNAGNLVLASIYMSGG